VASRPILLHPGAEQEISDAYSWYSGRNRRAATAFIAGLDAAIDSIRRFPRRWPRIYVQYRRFPMNRFPFSIIYLEQAHGVAVIAVAHQRRRPGCW
jgi:plasmid stabilization system protein ParE